MENPPLNTSQTPSAICPLTFAFASGDLLSPYSLIPLYIFFPPLTRSIPPERTAPQAANLAPADPNLGAKAIIFSDEKIALIPLDPCSNNSPPIFARSPVFLAISIAALFFLSPCVS